MHKFILYFLLLSLYASSSTITFEDALNLTLSNNEKLKIQKLNIDSSKLDLNKIKALSFGKVELSHELSRTNHAGHVFNSKLSSREASFDDFGAGEFIGPASLQVEAKNLNYPKPRNNFNTKITYDIPLFTGFDLSNKEEILKIKQKAQELKLKLDEKSLEFEVLKAYNWAVVSKDFIKATKKAKESISFFVNSANEFYKEGLVTKIDKKQAEVQKLNIQSKLTQATNRFNLSLAYLKFITSSENIEDVKSIKEFKTMKKSKDTLFKIALKNRDDLKIVDFTKEGMKKNINANKASYYPKVYSHLEYGFNDDSLNLDSDKDYYMGVVAVKYTLFDKTRDKDIEKSKIEFNKSILQKKRLKNAIKLEVEKAFLDLKAKNRIYKEKNKAKELAFEVLEQSKLMYKNQLIPMTELLKQESSYRNNEASLIMARYERALAQAKLNLVIGNSLRKNHDIKN